MHLSIWRPQTRLAASGYADAALAAPASPQVTGGTRGAIEGNELATLSFFHPALNLAINLDGSS